MSESGPARPAVLGPGPFFHGTKADLKPGDLLGPGYRSNFGEREELERLGVEAIND